MIYTWFDISCDSFKYYMQWFESLFQNTKRQVLSTKNNNASYYKNEELVAWKVKQLCQDIEESGKSQSRLNFLTFCNKQSNIYRDPGTSVRQQVQKKFNKLKRKTIVKYAKFLDSPEVPHSPVTLRELQSDAAESEQESEMESESESESKANSDREQAALGIEAAFDNILLG
jgi:hypothetical protein